MSFVPPLLCCFPCPTTAEDIVARLEAWGRVAVAAVVASTAAAVAAAAAAEAEAAVEAAATAVAVAHSSQKPKIDL